MGLLLPIQLLLLSGSEDHDDGGDDDGDDGNGNDSESDDKIMREMVLMMI